MGDPGSGASIAGRGAARRGAGVWWLFTFALSGALPGEEPSVQIHEAMAGANGDSNVQAIGLRFLGDQSWGPQGPDAAGRAVLVFHDASGAVTGAYVFPSDPSVGPADASGLQSVLIATAAFAALPGAPAPDYLLPAGLLAPGGGKVCFRANPEGAQFSANLCLSYGDFAGDTESDGADPPHAAGPPAAGLPTTGVRSLKRFRNSSTDHLGKGQSNADFRLSPLEARNSLGATAAMPEIPLADQGRKLFFVETFGGNGRTCGTCHLPEEGFALSPAAIARLPAADPLFVFERSAALRDLEDGDFLRGDRGLILENIDGFDKPHVFRGSPALVNIGLTAPFGLSGEVKTLTEFTTTAVRQHFPRTLARNADPAAGPLDFRLPSGDELGAMEAFMRSLTLELRLDLMMASAVRRGASATQVRAGRSLFFSDKAKCFKCHGGPALADVDPSLVKDGVVPGPGNHVFNTGVAERSRVLGLAFPNETEREFSTRPLVGVALRKAFFHDHSAKTLQEAVDFYCSNCDENFFVTSPAARKIGGLTLELVEDREAIAAFLAALVEPAPECTSRPDCNGNRINDECEIALFSERDCDRNGVLDVCESGTRDCDGNGIADACDIGLDPGIDCNGNGSPDSCDISSGASPDCNANGSPDECEPGNVLEASEPAGLATERGFLLGNVRPQGTSPFALARGGDVNGDGWNDLLLGAKRGPQGPSDLREAFVIFGRPGLGREAPVDVADLGSSGFSISGFDARFASDGFHLSAVGDFSGDGIDDFILGDPDAGPGGRTLAGKAYVIFGGASVGAGGGLDVASLDGLTGFVLEGRKALDRLGSSVGGGSDVNGDGAPDVIVGAPFADPAVNAEGEAYVLFGGSGLTRSRAMNTAALDGTLGFSIHGVREGDFAGSAVALGGDVNGDGVGDILVGAKGADPAGLEWAGETYVIFGRPGIGAGGVFLLSQLDGSNGFAIRGARQLDADLHLAAAFAGDVNGDGFGDVIIGAHGADPGGRDGAGEFYVVFGGADVGTSGGIELASLDGAAGFVARGLEAGGGLGSSVSGLGDVNLDGLDDVIAGSAVAGDAYVVFGKTGFAPAGEVDLAALGPSDGVVLRLRAGEDPDQFFLASEVAGVGDMNGDGVPDIGCGVRLRSGDALADPGVAFVLLGPPYPRDCDGNGIPDACEIEDSPGIDADRDGVPDACERAPPPRLHFIRGDVTLDAQVDISDPVAVLGYLFRSEVSIECLDRADADDDGQLNITDPIVLLDHLFLGGPPPAAPFPEPGPDPTRDGLACR